MPEGAVGSGGYCSGHEIRVRMILVDCFCFFFVIQRSFGRAVIPT